MKYAKALALFLLIGCRRLPEAPVQYQQQAPIVVREERLSGTIVNQPYVSMGSGDPEITLSVQTQYGLKSFEIRCGLKGVIRNSYHGHITYEGNDKDSINLLKHARPGRTVTLDSKELYKDRQDFTTCLDGIVFGD